MVWLGSGPARVKANNGENLQVSMEGDSLAGHVGMPSPCCAIKLVDVPELGYFAKDEAGEVK